ncbi:MAG TPA: rhodanese-like domain-containing protein [Bacteroidales bacterium]|nr:rhodanese-like domain-containing protein [Bacteroidales bacterium]HOX76605.1 rhodanese-like domain-containing protein [Bacteroidales bacterium]HPM92508.1 rhodanese-like domain-containing protein [Bacteroidales bacterium]
MSLEIEKYGFVINDLRHVSGKECLEILKTDGFILDVRPDFELTRLIDHEHILYYPYDEIREHFRKLPHDTWLILADAVGLRSKEVAFFLKENGFSNILHLAGGVVEWERDGLPVTLDKSRRLTGSCMCQLKRREIKK